MERPLPPPHLHDIGFQIEPAVEVSDWLKVTFINEGALLVNPDHKHLRQADIACLWTNVEYVDGFMPVVGMAELVRVGGKPWAKAERVDHLCMLHGTIPEMRIWLYAPYAAQVDDAGWCSLLEHELYHFAQKLDREGQPKFDEDGKPVWAPRAHDVGEFVGVMERYGVDACGGKSKQFVEAASRPPLIARAQIMGACGTCGVRL